MLSCFSPTSHILSRVNTQATFTFVTRALTLYLWVRTQVNETAFYSWKPLPQWASEEKLSNHQSDFEQYQHAPEPKLNISPTYSWGLIPKPSRPHLTMGQVWRRKGRVGPSSSFNRLRKQFIITCDLDYAQNSPKPVTMWTARPLESPSEGAFENGGVKGCSFICFRVNIPLNLKGRQAGRCGSESWPCYLAAMWRGSEN